MVLCGGPEDFPLVDYLAALLRYEHVLVVQAHAPVKEKGRKRLESPHKDNRTREVSRDELSAAALRRERMSETAQERLA